MRTKNTELNIYILTSVIWLILILIIDILSLSPNKHGGIGEAIVVISSIIFSLILVTWLIISSALLSYPRDIEKGKRFQTIYIVLTLLGSFLMIAMFAGLS